MFEYKGEQYTLKQLQEDAEQQGYTNFDEYVQMYFMDGMRQLSEEEIIQATKKQNAVDNAISKALISTYSDLHGIPEFLVPAATNVSAFFTRTAGGIASTIEKGYESAVLGMTKEEMVADGQNDFSRVMSDMTDLFGKMGVKKYDELTGQEEDLYGLVEDGRYLDAADLLAYQVAGAAPSLAVVAAAPILGSGILAASVTGESFEESLKERPDQSLENIWYNSLSKGAAEWGMEYAGGKFFRFINKMDPTGTNKKLAKEMSQKYGYSILQRAGLGFLGEASTEGFTDFFSQKADVKFFGDKRTSHDYIRGFINAAAVGGFLGGTVSGVSRVIEGDNKNKLYHFISPKQWQIEQQQLAKQLHDNAKDMKAAEESGDMAIVEIFKNNNKAIIKKANQNKKDLYSKFDGLSRKEIIEYAGNLDKATKALNVINNNKYSEQAQALAENIARDAYQANFDALGASNIDVGVEQAIGEALKTTEIIEQRLKKIKGINKNDLDIKVLKTEKEVEEAVKKAGKGIKKSDGAFIAKGKDGKATIFINQNIAAEAGATNVLGHELLHYMISRKFKTDNASMQPLVGELKTYLKENHFEVFQRLQYRIDRHYTNPDGTIKEDALEEYLNVFSDLVDKQKIDVTKGKSKGIVGSINEVMLGFGFGEVKLNNAQDVISFLSTYNKSINKKGLLGKLMGTKILDVDITSDKLVKGKTKDIKKESITKKDLTPKQTTDRINELGKQIVDEDGTVTNLEEEGVGNTYFEVEAENIYKKIQEEGLLDNLILKQPHAGVNDKTFLDTTYAELYSWFKKYQPERKNISGLFGHINPQIANRAKQAYNSITKGQVTAPTVDIGQTTKEGEVKVQVAAETDAATEAFETEDISPAARARKKTDKAKSKEKVESKFRKQLGIETGGDLYNKVLNSARKALLRAYETGTSVRNIQRKLRDEANVYLFKEIKNFLGTKKYISNLKEFRVPIMEAIFTADLVQMERNVPESERVFTRFVRKLTSKEEVQAAVDQKLLPSSALNIIDKGTAVNLYEKVIPSESKFLSFFDIPTINPVTGARSGKRGTRKDTLAKQMAGALSYDATMEVAQEPEVMKKRQDIAELQGEPLAQDNLEKLADAIARDPNVKFSYSTLTPSKVKKASLYLQQKENSLLDGHPAKPFFELTRQLVEEGHDVVDAWTVAIEQFGIDSSVLNLVLQDGDLSRSHIDNVIWAINNFVVAKIRRLAHDTSVTYLKGQLDKAKNINQKIEIVNEYLVNIGRSVRSAKVSDITTNRLLLEEVIQKLGDTKLAERYILKKVPKGEKLQYVDRSGEIKDVELYENIENIKNNAYNNSDLTQKVNEQSVKAQEYIFKILDSNLTNSEKKAIVQLMAYDQRGALRKAFKLGMVVDRSSKNGKKYNSKNTILEHEYTIKDLQDNLNNYIDGKLKKEKLQEIFKEGRVHVLPKTIDNILSKEGLRHRGSFNRYDNARFKNALQKLIDDKVIKNVPVKFSNSLDLQKLDNAVKFSRSTNNESKGITVLDFDDTLATTQSLVKFTRPDGTTGTLNAEQYASTYETLSSKGYKFDFSEFNKVVKGKIAPLFQKALKLQDKFGPENMFVLTARPPAAANAIHKFLKANGLNIPLKNITGLANSTANAKALWIANKVGEGYNDFYFADDALQNVKAVKNMLDQFDVKSKVQQARVKFSNSMSDEFNNIIERTKGVPSEEIISKARAAKRGAKKGKYQVFLPPSAEDFKGLLYYFIGKGRQGDADMAFLKKALIDPLNRAYTEFNTAKQVIANDYRRLKKTMPEAAKKVNQTTPDGDFTYGDAVRVYLWTKAGFEVPGLNQKEIDNLTSLVLNDAELQQFADYIGLISRSADGYIKPGEYWQAGDIRNDLDDATNRVGRKQFFEDFIESTENIFGKMVNGKLIGDNINKIESIYGTNFREALEDILYRTINGTSRPYGSNRLVNNFTNWVNGSVGAVMFVNMRSALLQQMSTVNFINYGDNNVFKAAARFADQKQFWKDWVMIFNSDKLKQRRAGLTMDINANELTTYLNKSKSKTKALINWLLRQGFKPTQISDSIAIANGGATFYRNRVNTYLEQGLSQKEAEAKAWNDFSEIAEETQQSARPDMASPQQASAIGKWFLNFLNTPMQYSRIIKKSALDLINRRRKPDMNQLQSDTTNISRILYYGFAQNVIFYTLQTGLFAAMFDDEDDEESKEFFNKKYQMTANSIVDGLLRGVGFGGAIISTLKNMIVKFVEEDKKGYKGKPVEKVALEMVNLSPVVGIKTRKVANAVRSYSYNKEIVKHMETFDINNPIWGVTTGVVEGLTNIPVNRLYRKTLNLTAATQEDIEAWQRLALISGWSVWNIGMQNEELEKIKEDLKKERKKTNKRKKKKTYSTLPTL